MGMSSGQAEHGGSSFSAIGADFQNLERSGQVITADVLDAWFDPAPSVLKKIRDFLPFLAKSSPPIEASGLNATIAECRGVDENQVLSGPGSSSLIFSCLPKLLAPDRSAVVLEPSYSEYEHVCKDLLALPVHRFPLSDANGFSVDTDSLAEFVRSHQAQALFLVNPNSPTGVHLPKPQIESMLKQLPDDLLIIVDETYIDYVGSSESLEPLTASHPNVIIVKSMSKAYALSGLRVGYLCAHPSVIARLGETQPPWSIGLLGQLAGVEALRAQSYYQECWETTHAMRNEISGKLASFKGVRAFPASANFFLVRFDRAREFASFLRERNVYVREFSERSGLGGNYLRIAVKNQTENALMLEVMDEAMRRLHLPLP